MQQAKQKVYAAASNKNFKAFSDAIIGVTFENSDCYSK